MANLNLNGKRLAGFIALLTLMLYLPAVQNGFVNWDDPHYVSENMRIRSLDWAFLRWAFTDTSVVYWHPLAWISHAVDYAIWGLRPFGHHLTSILLHAINSGIVVCLVGKLFATATANSPAPGVKIWLNERGSLIAAGVTGILFGFHPLHVESVAWIAERKDLLFSFFYLLSILSYTTYSDFPPKAGVMACCRNRWYWTALILFVFALASKPMAVTLPVALVLLDWYPLRRFPPAQNLLVWSCEKLPFVLLSVIVSVSTIIAQKAVGAVTSLSDLSLTVRVLVAFRSLMRYLWQVIAPIDLLPLYPYPMSVSLVTPEYLAAILVVCGISLASILAVHKQPVWLVAWFFFVITLLPVIGIVQSGPQPMADRFVYLPSLAPFAVIGAASAWLWPRWSGYPGGKRIAAVLAMVPVMAMASLTLKQVRIWNSSITLWSHVIDREPGKIHLAYHNRGVALVASGEFDLAVKDADQAIALKPDYVDAYHNRGLAFAGKGEFDLALADFAMAISLEPGNAAFYHSSGGAYAGKGDFARAIENYTTAIALEPDHADYYHSRGAAFAGAGQLDQSVDDYTHALSLRPAYVNAYINRGLAFAGKGAFDAAIKDYDAAIHLSPNRELVCSAYSNRGIAFVSKGELSRALTDFTTVVSLQPDRIAGYVNRGAVLKLLGQYDRAVEDYSRVLSLQPDFVKAYLERGELHRQMGEMEKAMNDFQQACTLGSAVGCRNKAVTAHGK